MARMEARAPCWGTAEPVAAHGSMVQAPRDAAASPAPRSAARMHHGGSFRSLATPQVDVVMTIVYASSRPESRAWLLVYDIQQRGRRVPAASCLKGNMDPLVTQ